MGPVMTPDVSNGTKTARIIGGMVHKYGMLSKYLHHPGRVLDICTGSAWGAQHMADSGYKVTGLDIDEHLYWEDRTIELVKQDIREYKPPHQFDGIVAIDAIEHFSVEDQEALMQKIHIWLKPGGILVMDTPLTRVSGRKSRHHLNEMTWEDFGTLVIEPWAWRAAHRYYIKWTKLGQHFSLCHRVFPEQEPFAWPGKESDQIIVCTK
jgi:cyclopropane fatty-acyl-phospholipid synthase-like methyltransferase